MSAEASQFEGKQIPQPVFSDDNGLADAAAMDALAPQGRSADRYEVANALRSARLFVPVVAILDSEEVTDDGHRTEKDSHMATVSITSADGRRGLLAFTSVAAMANWSKEARPVAALGSTVAASALQEGASAVIIDATSEHMHPIELAGLIAMIEGRNWVAPIEDPEVIEAISAALTPLANVTGCQFEIEDSNGPEDLRLIVRPDPADQSGMEPRQLAEATGTLLGESELLRGRLSGGVALAIGEPAGG